MGKQKQYCYYLSTILVLFFGLYDASEFDVGGEEGWVLNPSENYKHWAERMRFQVNDTLLFRYEKGCEWVLEVTEDDYEKCNTKDPIKKMEDGYSVFQLDRSGPFYFISGNQQNCENGQKLLILVLAVRLVAPPPPNHNSTLVAPPPPTNGCSPNTPPPPSDDAPGRVSPPPSGDTNKGCSSNAPPPPSDDTPGTVSPPPSGDTNNQTGSPPKGCSNTPTSGESPPAGTPKTSSPAPSSATAARTPPSTGKSPLPEDQGCNDSNIRSDPADVQISPASSPPAIHLSLIFFSTLVLTTGVAFGQFLTCF